MYGTGTALPDQGDLDVQVSAAYRTHVWYRQCVLEQGVLHVQVIVTSRMALAPHYQTKVIWMYS